MSKKTIEGWWFAVEDRLPHGDGRPVVIGETLSVRGKIIPCRHGLHACVDPFDALRYAPGPILYKVRLSGTIREEEDKHAASQRTALARRDATETLHLFARRQALSVIHLWDAPAVVREYLETGDEKIRTAAWAAAWATAQGATWAATRTAAQAAAWAAAQAAARAAAWDAAQAAAWDAARAAAQDAARAAAQDAARDAAWAAAQGAAWIVAWDAAWDAARKMFNEMVGELFAD